MPDRIETYQQRVGVSDAGSFAPVLPEISNPGPAIASVGRSLLREAEPALREKAQREGLAAAGTAEIVKTPEGFAPGAPIPPGAGTVYAEVFNRAVDTRLLSLTTKDYEARLIALQKEHYNDPEGFKAAAIGTAEGMVKGAVPTIRAQLEENLIREMSERYRGLGENKLRRDYAATVNGLVATRDSYFKTIIELGKQANGTNTEALLSRMEVEAKGAAEANQRLAEMGELSPEGATAEMRAFAADNLQLSAFMTSARNFVAVGPVLRGLDDLKLQEVEAFARGTFSDPAATIEMPGADGKPVAVTLAEFNELFPDARVRGQIGAFASDIRVERHKAEVEAAQAARDAQTQLTLEKIEQHTADANFNPELGLSRGEVAAINADVTNKGGTFKLMQTPEGRQFMWGVVAKTGVMPEGLTDYLDARILSDDGATVTEFIENVTKLNTKDGLAIGQLIRERLSDKTRAWLDASEALRAGGQGDPTVLQQELMRLRQGKLPSLGDVQAATARLWRPGANDKPVHWSYDQAKIRMIGNELGVGDKGARAATAAIRQFDRLVVHNYQLSGGDIEAALKATAKQVARQYAKSPVFTGGVGPRVLQTAIHGGAGLKDLDLDYAFAVYGKEGARFSNNRLKLRPVFDDPVMAAPGRRGYGRYYLESYSAPVNGVSRLIGSVQVDVDSRLPLAQQQAAQRRSREAAKARESAGEGGPRFRVGRDKDGKVRFIDTRSK